MKRITVTNDTDSPLYVGAEMVPPRARRDFPEDQVPEHLRPPEVIVHSGEIKVDIAALLEETEVAILTALPRLSDEQLMDVGQAESEKGDSARKSLLEALEATIRERAAAKPPEVPDPMAERRAELAGLAKKPVRDICEHFSTLSDQDLTALEAIEKAAEKPRKGLIEALGEELLQRAAKATQAGAGVGSGG